ncbi:MAG: hypothetical protein ACLQPV_03620 [Vulcanimicrobiaceae bacterium]
MNFVMKYAVPLLMAAIVLALSATAPSLSQSTPVASPSTSPLPVIARTVSRRVCSALRTHIGPAIGMMIQNDENIAKGVPLFAQYNTANGEKSDPARNIALLRMENLVSPLANNSIAIQQALNDPALFPPAARNPDDETLLAMRDKLLQAWASQNLSLDIINGFVATQQMGDLQHADEGMLSQMSAPDTTKGNNTPPTANPLLSDPNQAGLPADPYVINPATIPGLTLGYNPVTRLAEGLKWTQAQTAERERTATQVVLQTTALCSAHAPAPTPTP